MWCLVKGTQACYSDEIQHKHLGQPRGSLQTIPVPPQNSRTRFLYDLQIFHFSCQLPAHCRTKMFCGGFAVLLIYCAQTAAPCHSFLQGGDTSTATTSNPSGSAATPQQANPIQRVTQFPGNAIQQPLVLPSPPQSCQHKHTANQTF